jgi:hypothetical protein
MPDRLSADWRYDCDLFSPQMMARLAREYDLLLTSLVDTPHLRLAAIDEALQQSATAALPISRPRRRATRAIPMS